MALANAEIKVFSAAPVLNVLFNHLTIYLLSSFVASNNSFTMIFSFSYCELFPEHLASFLKDSNTYLKVKGGLLASFLVKNEPKVFYVLLPYYITTPKSPSF
jgi:hypothetical protein